MTRSATLRESSLSWPARRSGGSDQACHGTEPGCSFVLGHTKKGPHLSMFLSRGTTLCIGEVADCMGSLPLAIGVGDWRVWEDRTEARRRLTPVRARPAATRWAWNESSAPVTTRWPDCLGMPAWCPPVDRDVENPDRDHQKTAEMSGSGLASIHGCFICKPLRIRLHTGNAAEPRGPCVQGDRCRAPGLPSVPIGSNRFLRS